MYSTKPQIALVTVIKIGAIQDQSKIRKLPKKVISYFCLSLSAVIQLPLSMWFPSMPILDLIQPLRLRSTPSAQRYRKGFAGFIFTAATTKITFFISTRTNILSTNTGEESHITHDVVQHFPCQNAIPCRVPARDSAARQLRGRIACCRVCKLFFRLIPPTGLWPHYGETQQGRLR